MSMEEEMGPRRPGQPLGSGDQERLMKEADQERLVSETEEIHTEEAAEDGKARPAKAPWWRFWARR